MNNTLLQWENAVEQSADNQERSEFADQNKAIVKARFPRLNGEKVLDLGCGYGYYTDYFNRVGGNVVGIDGAETMIALAKSRYPDCDFSVADIEKSFPFENESFDIIFCNQVLMDIENIEHVFFESCRVLKPEGIFYYSIVHPAFYQGDWQENESGYQYAKRIASYLTRNVSENRFWGPTVHFHRPLSDYLNAAAEAGMVLKRTEEPRSYDGKMKNDDIPLFFFAEYKK